MPRYPLIAARAARRSSTARVISPAPRCAAVSSTYPSMCCAHSKSTGRPRAAQLASAMDPSDAASGPSKQTPPAQDPQGVRRDMEEAD